jgi:phosphate transport system permease protein
MRGTVHDILSQTRSRLMYVLCVAAAVAILVTLGLVSGYLAKRGYDNISWSLFTKIPTGDPNDPGGMKNGIVGTLILVGLASLIGVPIGICAGIYLSEYEAGSWIAAPVRFISDVLAGVPSIVIGVLGYELLVVPMGTYNGWAGAAALAFIMIPIITRTTEEMLRLVPNSYREAALGMGATKARAIFTVVLPAATGSTITGVMLAVARVAGETAPLLFTALGSRYVTTNPAEPFPSLTKQIYDYATGPYEKQRQLAWGGMLLLVALIFVLNLAVRAVGRRLQAKSV